MNREVPVENNVYYYIYNRGNNRRRIFGDDLDYNAFIKKMKSLAEKYAVDVPVYTLMPNHFHLIAKQVSSIEDHLHPCKNKVEGDLHLLPRLSRMIGALQTSAAKRYNLRYSHIGHLFQGPFRYKPVSENSLWDVACYIHLNPVKAKLVKTPDKWLYSNYIEFLDKKKETFILDCWQDYKDYLQEILKNEHT